MRLQEIHTCGLQEDHIHFQKVAHFVLKNIERRTAPRRSNFPNLSLKSKQIDTLCHSTVCFSRDQVLQEQNEFRLKKAPVFH